MLVASRPSTFDSRADFSLELGLHSWHLRAGCAENRRTIQGLVHLHLRQFHTQARGPADVERCHIQVRDIQVR